LKGLTPEQYPLAYKAKILGDVAPYSAEYDRTIQAAKANERAMSESEAAMVEATEEQVAARKQRKDFSQYRFQADAMRAKEVTVTEVISPTRVRVRELKNMIVELQGVGAIKNKQRALEIANQQLLGERVRLHYPGTDERAFDMVVAGGRMKAVAEVNGQEYQQTLVDSGVAMGKPLKDEFSARGMPLRERLVGAGVEKILHGMNTPLEFLTPFSPASKFINQKSPLEEYAASEAVGTSSAFWDKPIQNFISPAINMAGYRAGLSGVSSAAQKVRDTQEYFDMVQWVKYQRLEQEARTQGNYVNAASYAAQKKRTMFGVDAFGSPAEIMRALPRNERDYFQAFVESQTEAERQEIMKLVPPNERRIYAAQWARQMSEAAEAKKAAGIDRGEADELLATTQTLRFSGGFDYSTSLEDQWRNETGGRVPYQDWIRSKKAAEYFKTHSLPDPEWVGWNPAVDTEDIKMKYVESMAADFHDYGLYQSRANMMARKPYVNDDMINAMNSTAEYNNVAKTYANARALGPMSGDRRASVHMSRIDADIKPRYNIDIRDKRQKLVDKTIDDMTD
jgi:hypothetical protein